MRKPRFEVGQEVRFGPKSHKGTILSVFDSFGDEEIRHWRYMIESKKLKETWSCAEQELRQIDPLQNPNDFNTQK